MNTTSLPFYQQVARQRGDTEALRHAADDVDKLRATLDELKALQVNGFDPIAAARAYDPLVAFVQYVASQDPNRLTTQGNKAYALLTQLGQAA